ncbi:MAG: hypothetical protein J1G38_05890 [Clostridiales bacterium]|nr:hypothetical protein [Clostridiales bacterium]
MRRTFVISDWFYRLTHAVKRNRAAVVIYALVFLLFLIIGIAVGVNIGDKTAYIMRNRSPVFAYLRGSSGFAAFFFLELLSTSVYCLFALGLFFKRPLSFLSIAPCMYKSYSLGMQVSVIVILFSAPSLPMLFVFFVPISIIEIAILCMLSFKCIAFAALNGRCSPSKPDIKAYFYSATPYFIAIAVCTFIKVMTVALFGSALIGVI